jgi:cytochrome c
MKKVTVIFIAVCCFSVPALAADQGVALFKSQGCMACHRPEGSSKVNPSLTEIAQMYLGKEDQLTRYLNGEAEAIVKPDKAGMMKRHIEKTKKLSDADRNLIADYIMSYAK